MTSDDVFVRFNIDPISDRLPIGPLPWTSERIAEMERDLTEKFRAFLREQGDGDE